MKNERKIYNQNNDQICTIHIRQESRHHNRKYSDLKTELSKRLAELTRVSIASDGTAVDEADNAVIERAESAVKLFLLEWLEPAEVATVFEVQRPFASVKGGFFVSQILNVIKSN